MQEHEPDYYQLGRLVDNIAPVMVTLQGGYQILVSSLIIFLSSIICTIVNTN